MTERTCAVIGEECSSGGRLKRGMCGKHYERWRQHGDPLHVHHIVRDDERRFWTKVNKNGPIPERCPGLGPCWVWTGTTDAAGYGQFSVRRETLLAHRWIIEFKVAPIPAGYEPDHLCKNTSCVNYRSHLEVVTSRENCLRSDGPTAVNARKTHCIHGHEFTEANTRWLDDGRRRSCLTCERAQKAAWNAAMSDEAKAAKAVRDAARYAARKAARLAKETTVPS